MAQLSVSQFAFTLCLVKLLSIGKTKLLSEEIFRVHSTITPVLSVIKDDAIEQSMISFKQSYHIWGMFCVLISVKLLSWSSCITYLWRNSFDIISVHSWFGRCVLGFVGLMTNKNARLAKNMLKDTDIPLISVAATSDDLTAGQRDGNFFRSSMSAWQELRVCLLYTTTLRAYINVFSYC